MAFKRMSFDTLLNIAHLCGQRMLVAATCLFAMPALHAAPADQTPNTWYEFPSSELEDVAPIPLPPGSVRSVIFAWGGGAYDSDRDLLLIWGGGHNDYAGNEVYAFGPLNGANPSWQRLTDPSSPPAENTARGQDGRPVSRHTYGLLDYLPAPHNKMMSCAVGSQYSNGYSNRGADTFEVPEALAGREPWTALPNPPSTEYALDAWCVYNPVTDTVFFHDFGSSRSRLQEYDPSTNTWRGLAQSNHTSGMTAAVDTRRNLLVSTGNGGGVRVWDLNNPTAGSFSVSTSGPTQVQQGKAPGFEYDPINDQFIGWHGGNKVFTLRAPSNIRSGTWVWSEIPLDPSNNVTPTRVAGLKNLGYVTGTFGRFRYVPSLHGVVVVNGTDENVYFFKLSDNGGAPPPELELSADQTTVAYNGSVTLTWSSSGTQSCTASDGWSGSVATNGSQTIGPLTSDTVFRLQCTSASGASITRAVNVTVTQPVPAPTVSFSADPSIVDQGDFTTLSWSSVNATSCSASGSWSGSKSTASSESVGPLNGQSVFTLRCDGQSGSDTESVTVEVRAVSAEPIINFSASPDSVDAGDIGELIWSTANANDCDADNGWSGDKPVSGRESTGILNQTTTFSLTCTGSGGTVSRSVTVSVSPPSSSPSPGGPTPTGAGDDESGGGAIGWLGFGVLAMLAVFRRLKRLNKFVLASLLALTSVAHAADVATVRIQNLDSSSKSDTFVTFGHVFAVGDVPANQTVTAKYASGQAITTQVDKKAFHADGSLRHAIITLNLANVAGSANESVVLETASNSASGTPLSLSQLLSTNFDADVEMSVGGTTYTASARDALANATQWLQGPVAGEWIAGGPVRDAQGGEHPHLAVYFHVRAFEGEPVSRARVDVVFENGWSFVPDLRNRNYTATINVPGAPEYRITLDHYSRARWHTTLWWGAGDPALYAALDRDYLASTRAVPKYASSGPTNSLLNSVRRSTAPMNNGDQQDNMDDTGYQAGIGPLPQWDAIYVTSMDVRAFDYMRANADAGGAYSVHYRDKNTGLPVSIDDYPRSSIIDPQGSSPRFVEAANRSPYWQGSGASHQPSIGFTAYLATGDYFYLEEMFFWSAYNLAWTSPNGRNGSDGWWYTGTLRGQAWAYRSLAQAAYITPDDHPTKAYWLDKLSKNIQRDHSRYVSPGSQYKNNLGAMYMAEGNEQYRFYDYFMSWTAQYLVDLGFTEAVPFRDYKIQFPIGLMGGDDNGYCYQSAPRYTWRVGPSGSRDQFYPDFRTVYENSASSVSGIACGSTAMDSALGVSRRGMIGDQQSTTYWFAQMQTAVAAAYDSGLQGGRDAWDRLKASGVEPDYRDNPIWGIVPHSAGSPEVRVGLQANPTSVQPGESSTLSWTSENADSCTAEGDWAGNKSLSGSEQTNGLQNASTFRLVCTSNTLGQRSAEVVVNVSQQAPPPAPQPTMSLSASANSVETGDSVTLSWSSQNTNSCSATGGWANSSGPSGSVVIQNMTASRTFSMECSGDGGVATQSVSVTVTQSSTPPPTPPGDDAPADEEDSGGGAIGVLSALALMTLLVLRRRKNRVVAEPTRY